MSAQIPRGPEHLYCPFWKKPMSKVCHTCPNWSLLRGKNPQTGADVDSWQCAFAMLPMLLVNTANETRQGAAATESFRNEMVRAHAENMMVQARASVPAERTMLIATDR